VYSTPIYIDISHSSFELRECSSYLIKVPEILEYVSSSFLLHFRYQEIYMYIHMYLYACWYKEKVYLFINTYVGSMLDLWSGFLVLVLKQNFLFQQRDCINNWTKLELRDPEMGFLRSRHMNSNYMRDLFSGLEWVPSLVNHMYLYTPSSSSMYIRITLSLYTHFTLSHLLFHYLFSSLQKQV